MNLPKEVGLLIFGGGAGISYLIALLLFLWLIRRKKKSLLKILFIIFFIIVFILIGLFSHFIFLMIKRETPFGPFLPTNF